MKIGDRILVVPDIGKAFEGTLRAATSSMIIIDEGNGIVASLKKDPASNEWKLGKSTVRFAEVSTFGDRLRDLLRRARRMEKELQGVGK